MKPDVCLYSRQQRTSHGRKQAQGSVKADGKRAELKNVIHIEQCSNRNRSIDGSGHFFPFNDKEVRQTSTCKYIQSIYADYVQVSSALTGEEVIALRTTDIGSTNDFCQAVHHFLGNSCHVALLDGERDNCELHAAQVRDPLVLVRGHKCKFLFTCVV